MVSRQGILFLLAIVAILAILFALFSKEKGMEKLSINDVIAMAKEGEIREIIAKGEDLTVITKDGKKFASTIGPNTDLMELLDRHGIKLEGEGAVVISYEKTSRLGENWWFWALNFLPILFVTFLLLFIFRQAQSGPSQAFSFGKSRARLISGNRPQVRFSDVAGVEEAKEELKEVVEFLKNPQKFQKLGARIPKGLLLVGPPGSGKTLLAKAVAGEAGVPFFSISGSEFVEMFVGVGAARVRDLFEQAKRHSPSIIFIDEIDAVGRHRGAGLGGGHDEREQTLNQILVEMDGFDTSTNVIVMAATNRPDILDPALLRPGRFDRRVVIDLPDVKGRVEILKVHARNKPLASDVNLEVIAKETPGFSGADLANIVNEAAILAARKNKKFIEMVDFEEALDKVIAGPERRTRVISEREKRITAYHEAGHAVVAHFLPNADPVHKVSIIPRSRMGGYTRVLPEEDRFLWTKSQFEDNIAVFLAGHAAEKLVFNDISTGSESDLERATKLAREMVTTYGMSERLGPRTYGKKKELVFLGKELAEEEKNYSDKIAEEIDLEVKRIIEEAYSKAKKILEEKRDKLEELAKALLEKETLEGEELQKILED